MSFKEWYTNTFGNENEDTKFGGVDGASDDEDSTTPSIGDFEHHLQMEPADNTPDISHSIQAEQRRSLRKQRERARNRMQSIQSHKEFILNVGSHIVSITGHPDNVKQFISERGKPITEYGRGDLARWQIEVEVLDQGIQNPIPTSE